MALGKKSVAAGVAIVLSVIALTGCSAPSVPKADPPEPTASKIVETPVATESPTPVAAGPGTQPPGVINDEWTDKDGYHYGFQLLSTIFSAEKDTVDAKPGRAKVTYRLSYTGQVANLTKGHNAPAPGLAVVAVWPAGSVVCTAMPSRVTPAFSSNTPGMEAKWCKIMAGSELLSPSANQIQDGSTVTVSRSGNNTYAPFDVAEGDADALVAALQSPTLIAAGRSGGAGLMTACLIEGGGYYLTKATAETGCTVS